AFLAGDDAQLDRAFLLEDIRASQVHARCLVRAGVLDEEEGERLVAELAAIAAEFEAGRLALDARFEDGHSALEAWLGERLGELGRKI
ncbi:MAG: argininosuccinate lyase, partial [Chloroflexota bacterium]|nr:argininosuccinate lyase [Dehalococcoidia bacterium]MDW8255376.1 argininosuccinate lyase [Chloroflexota bacterium]